MSKYESLIKMHNISTVFSGLQVFRTALDPAHIISPFASKCAVTALSNKQKITAVSLSALSMLTVALSTPTAYAICPSIAIGASAAIFVNSFVCSLFRQWNLGLFAQTLETQIPLLTSLDGLGDHLQILFRKGPFEKEIVETLRKNSCNYRAIFQLFDKMHGVNNLKLVQNLIPFAAEIEQLDEGSLWVLVCYCNRQGASVDDLVNILNQLNDQYRLIFLQIYFGEDFSVFNCIQPHLQKNLEHGSNPLTSLLSHFESELRFENLKALRNQVQELNLLQDAKVCSVFFRAEIGSFLQLAQKIKDHNLLTQDVFGLLVKQTKGPLVNADFILEICTTFEQCEASNKENLRWMLVCLYASDFLEFLSQDVSQVSLEQLEGKINQICKACEGLFTNCTIPSTVVDLLNQFKRLDLKSFDHSKIAKLLPSILNLGTILQALNRIEACNAIRLQWVQANLPNMWIIQPLISVLEAGQLWNIGSLSRLQGMDRHGLASFWICLNQLQKHSLLNLQNYRAVIYDIEKAVCLIRILTTNLTAPLDATQWAQYARGVTSGKGDAYLLAFILNQLKLKQSSSYPLTHSCSLDGQGFL